MAGSNPAAIAQIAANAAEQKNKIRAGAQKEDLASVNNITNANRQLKAQTQAQNLQILDRQQDRSAIAKSKTLDTTERALASMDAKRLIYDEKAKDLAIKKNMFNFDFTPSGVVYNTNAPYQFNTSGLGNTGGMAKYEDALKTLNEYKAQIKNDTKAAKNGAKIKARNGSIVKALKSL